jgi:hypothetical protein
MEETQPWVTLYEEKIRKCGSERKAFRSLNGGSMPYPDHLKENMQKYVPIVGWLSRYKRNMRCSVVTHVEKI